MKKEYLNISEIYLEKILHISLFAYLFLLIFPYTTTLREIAFWLVFLCWVKIRFKRRRPFIPINSITVSLSLFMLIALIASIAGIEPLENIRRFKGELLKPFLLFLIVATEYNSLEKIKRLSFALLIPFACYTVLTIIESANYGLAYYWDKTIREGHQWFITGYWQRGTLIFPIILGVFLLIKNRWLKYFLIFFAITEFIILTTYRGFTVFLAAVSVLLLWVLFANPKKYRLWVAGFISLFLFIFGILLHTYKGHPAIDEYRSKLGKVINVSGEFRSKGGFSNRMPVWEASVDIIKDRPLLGYGWGIKKFTRLVQQEKFLENWRVNKPYVYDFFITYRDVFFPPHNMFLEIAIQSGLLGLASFIAFFVVYVSYLIRAAIHSDSDTERNFLIILVGGVILIFIIMNLMGNELGNTGGKILFVVLGAGTAFMKDKTQ